MKHSKLSGAAPNSPKVRGVDGLDVLSVAGIFEKLPLGVAYCKVIYDGEKPVDFQYLYTNPMFHQMTGLGPISGKRVSEVIPGIQESDPWLIETYGRIATTGQPESFESFLVGLRQWFSVNAFCPQPGYFVAIFSIVTGRKEFEDKLNASEARYRAVVEDQTEVISRFLPDGTLTFVNEVYCRTFGGKADELTGGKWGPIVHPDDLPMIEASLKEMSPDNPVVVIENRVYVVGGTLHWMQFANRGFYHADGQLKEIQSVGRDVTAVKQVESELRQSEERYRALVEATSVVTWHCPSDGLHVAPQPAWMAFTGQTAEEMLGVGWTKVVHPEDIANAVVVWNEAVKDGKPFANEHRIRRYDGEWRWMRVRAVPVFGERGHVSGWMGMGQDITEEKQDELRLRESEERLALALTGSGLVFWDWDVSKGDGPIDLALNEMLGYVSDQLKTFRELVDLIDPRDRQNVDRALTVHLRGDTEYFHSEHRIRHSQGHWISVEARGKVIQRDEDGNPLRMVGTLLDITRRKRLNEEGVELLKQIEAMIRAGAGPSLSNSVNIDVVDILTKRERQVLVMIADGMTSAQIGKQLNLSANTINVYRQKLMAKLDLHSTVEVTRFAIDNGLIRKS